MTEMLTAHVWWPIVVVLLVLAYAIGLAAGRQLSIDKAVDRVIRRETRLRTPARPSSSSLSGPIRGMTAEEIAAGTKRLSDALSTARAVPVFGFDTAGWGGPAERCGKPAITAFDDQPARCLRLAGHAGGC